MIQIGVPKGRSFRNGVYGGPALAVIVKFGSGCLHGPPHFSHTPHHALIDLLQIGIQHQERLAAIEKTYMIPYQLFSFRTITQCAAFYDPAKEIGYGLPDFLIFAEEHIWANFEEEERDKRVAVWLRRIFWTMAAPSNELWTHTISTPDSIHVPVT
jgi:hypothetical protein